MQELEHDGQTCRQEDCVEMKVVYATELQMSQLMKPASRHVVRAQFCPGQLVLAQSLAFHLFRHQPRRKQHEMVLPSAESKIVAVLPCAWTAALPCSKT